MSTMEITRLGHASFKIKTKNAILITDPFDSTAVGLPYPKVEADIVTISHEHKDHNDISKIDGDPFVINGAGEYEVKDVMIFGIPAYHDSHEGKERGKITIYTIETEGLRLCHLGDLGHKLT
ncbi:MAG: MBL fold metallo-hydrolase, partial [bacterium]|nr:MBL fold metallo-hydrolase [bacterium]